jgi:tetratricopeptide (TPR) repeat protein
MDELQRAIRLDPLSLVLNANSAGFLWLAGRPDEAIAQCRKTIDLDPSFFRSYWVLGHAYAQKGQYSKAIGSLQKAQVLAGDATFVAPLLAGLADVHALSGNHDQARRCIQELESRAGQIYISPFWIAMAYAGLDERDQVFAWLERACDIRDAWLWLLPNMPIIAPLQSDDRYRALLRRMRLA